MQSQLPLKYLKKVELDTSTLKTVNKNQNRELEEWKRNLNNNKHKICAQVHKFRQIQVLLNTFLFILEKVLRKLLGKEENMTQTTQTWPNLAKWGQTGP